ncbi:hypothetical protein SASPL_156458 [Salvia splendens]|uniref:F-box domain-containing protein n=1 Tax=Salvia splendens TaxID=180675 RepID=A0A8X8YWS4_SALSN|nr:hypothetical protein SASPL_156458 [Salvia splendens]
MVLNEEEIITDFLEFDDGSLVEEWMEFSMGMSNDPIVGFSIEVPMASKRMEIAYEREDRDKDESYDGADMIIFVLQNLDFGFEELLSIIRVCRSLRDAIQKDPYLWRSIHIFPNR